MPHSAQSVKHIDSGLHCLVLLAKFHGQPCQPEQLKHEFALSHQFGDMEILRAAKFLQLKAKSFDLNRSGAASWLSFLNRSRPATINDKRWQRLQNIPLPAIAKHADGHYFIIAKVDGESVLIQDPLEARPQTLPRALFEAAWSGELILLTKRSLLPGMSGKFDISWFIPAVVKYRKLFRDVLIASFFLQIFALASPLFFQAVVDKVLVHNGLSTLDVLCIGLLVVSVFEVVLGIVRTYLFSHTTNRIDVELGAKLYRHLMGLPIGYFLARTTGTIVARVRELDSIRNFLTGSALTLVLDLFFSLVFLAIMYWYSTTLFLIVLLTIPCYVALSVIVTPILRKRLDEKFMRGAENQAFLTESITAVETVKSMAIEPQMRRKWEEQLAGYVGSAFSASNLGNVSSQIAQLINKVSMLQPNPGTTQTGQPCQR